MKDYPQDYPQDTTSTLPDGQQLGSHGQEPPKVRPEDVPNPDDEPCGGRCGDPDCNLTVTGEPLPPTPDLAQLRSELEYRRKNGEFSADLARLAEAAAKEVCNALGLSVVVEEVIASAVARHFEPMAREVAAETEKRIHFARKFSAEIEDNDKLRAENERLRDTEKHYCGAIKCRDDELVALRARVAELEKDRERLDWLEEWHLSLSRLTAPDMSGIRFVGQYHNPAKARGEAGPSFLRIQGPTIRAAIDAARQSGEQKEGGKE